MNRHTLTLGAIVLLALFGRPVVADDSCSIRAIAGNWLFATSIGRQMLGAPFPPDKDITAIGTMNIAHDGTLSGTFDVTVEDFAFIPGVIYTGSVTVNSDCTGILSFATSVGSVRTDSIAVVSRREMLGMSQDFLNLWTYQIRRVPANLRSNGRDDD
jgi:hypothetical protein